VERQRRSRWQVRSAHNGYPEHASGFEFQIEIRQIKIASPPGPLRGDPRFEKIVASLAKGKQ
jgi:hypothetical protein